MELTKKRCVPCEGGVPPLDEVRVKELLAEVPDWQVGLGGSELHKRFKFAGFAEAIAFVNRMAELAEREGHHPDFRVRYNLLEVSLSTHAIGGLSENDFILAAKIDQLA